ncbi:helix-turn-helix transcriptional regulator [Crocosphaera sp. XPORK-15E]|uniref:helix-turn-helix domain-containing protein n=1 Tax=Crocosphaera sp. XPORK-15E TaxID=3110247 RepID=UPI002B21AB90|nr:helix-turn-helix transcriptional regulator [Crocosphaera sp. XPORK-15E]MEA5532900.1 helix-turn-helix transcriptional regulator [Crocosphaera sp. XPORK-15E]
MSDIEKYIKQRKQKDSDFSENFEAGYLSFKLGFILAQAREESGITIEELAEHLNCDQAIVSQIENNIQSVNIGTLEKYIKALGKELILEIR